MSGYGLPKYEARFAVPVGGWIVTVTDSGGTAAVTIPAGNYYLTHGVGSFLAALVTLLNATGVLDSTFTVTLDDDGTTATGRITIAATGGGNVTLTWTSTALRDLLGFDADQSGDDTYTGADAAAPLCLLDTPRANPLVPDGHAGKVVTDASTVVSPTGSSRHIKTASRRFDNWEHRFVSGRKTFAQYETYGNESFESFWSNYISEGMPVRYFPDRATDSTSVPWRAVGDGAQVFPAQPEIAGYVGGHTEGGDLRWHIGPITVVEFVEP